jgi:outer membrane protein
VNRSVKIFLSTGLVALSFVSVVNSADMKVGVVNYSRLMAESPQAKTAAEAIRVEFASRERDVQNQAASLKTREEKLQKDAATMSEVQRSSAEKELRDGYRDVQRKQQEFQDDFNARRNEETSRLQRGLIEEVQAYAKAQNFDLVLADGVIFANANYDITAAVLTSLQARRAAPAPAAPAKPAAKP